MANKWIGTVLPLLLVCGPINAAVIIWDDPVEVNNSQDVVTEGLFIDAVNGAAGGGTSITVNGVTFLAGNLLSGSSSVDLFPGTTGDAAYDFLLSSVDFGAGAPIALGDGKLIAGENYLIQIWFADTRPNRNKVFMTYGDHVHGGNKVTLGGGKAHYVIGRFTADATNQEITIMGEGMDHITAYQIRHIPDDVTLGFITM
ncbi:hypothetical protein P4E94_03210 [Pontiellaceae bacterium B12219]|nr:hypothetical protein [Pontiellaceae bacterium B12219]